MGIIIVIIAMNVIALKLFYFSDKRFWWLRDNLDD